MQTSRITRRVGDTVQAARAVAARARPGRAGGRDPARDEPAAASPIELPPTVWGLQVGATGDLELADVGLRELVAEYGSPMHIVDGRAIDRNAAAALAPHRGGAGADVYSSYKTNPIPGVLTRLHDAGVGAEAISAYEFWLAVRLGVAPERIVYNGPAKSASSIEEAARRGIKLVNANSRSDLAAMAAAAARVGRPMRAGLRVSLPHMWGGQFGIRGVSEHVAATVRDGTSSPDLDFVGLHYHSGLPLATATELMTHLEAVLASCDRIADETGWHPSIIDLGGSLVCPSVKHASGVAEPLTIAAASSLMHEVIAEHMTEREREMPELLVEPGRSLTADTQLLLTTVLAVRDAASARPTVVVDVGVELAEPMRGQHHQTFVVERHAERHADRQAYRLCGPRATDDDVLVAHTMLPRVEVGDVLAVMNTGAYFVPFSTAASFAKPTVVLADGSDVEVIRRREGADELWRLDLAFTR